jgi:hypothetical protein
LEICKFINSFVTCSATARLSTCQNYAIFTNNVLSLFGNVGVTSQPNLIRGYALSFPIASYAYPVGTYAGGSITPSIDTLDVVADSFTITVALVIDPPMPSDQPVLSLIGAQFGQTCVEVRTGCYGTCIEFIYLATCNCSATYYIMTSLLGYAMNQWTHFAFVYQRNTSSLLFYVNGIAIQNSIITNWLPQQPVKVYVT